jgi:hypothetical protein
VSLLRCSLAVARDTRARAASSLLVSASPPMSATRIVARAVSPMSAAISTMLAATTIRHSTVTVNRPASEDSSAAAESSLW